MVIVSEIGGMNIVQGKPKYSEKIWLSATFSTTNPTSLDPVLNPGHRGEKPATNRLIYGAAISRYISRHDLYERQKSFIRSLVPRNFTMLAVFLNAPCVTKLNQ
jgi:hypothetical protein